MMDHVYLSIRIGGVRVAVDGIVDYPFAWEVPEEEITRRVSLPV
jgi:hypothetical protein